MKRLLSCTSSEMLKMDGQELKQAILASEGRTVMTETVVAIEPLLGDLTNAELAVSFGSDMVLLNCFDCNNPEIKGLPECDNPVEKLKEEQEEYNSSLGKVASDFKQISKVENVSVFKELEKNETPLYKFIGIAFSTYIIIQMKDDMYIIDQHAAHERIMYERVKANYYNDKEKDSQLMLLPDIITLTHKEMDIAKENMEMFIKAGFTLEEFGENTIKLTGVPDMCLDLDTKELFLETLDEINTVARTAKQEKEEKFIATVACKAAVKANMALTKEEVDKLMSQLLVLPNPFTCPHGRPAAIKMSKNDIEKKFSRR